MCRRGDGSGPDCDAVPRSLPPVAQTLFPLCSAPHEAVHFIFRRVFGILAPYSIPLPDHMHRALLVEDILARVVNELDPYDNCTLARTCHSFTELALDAAWADRVEILPWELAHLMSDELWTVSESPAEEGAGYTTLYVLVSRMARDVSSPS
jgi:hypothetical protein